MQTLKPSLSLSKRVMSILNFMYVTTVTAMTTMIQTVHIVRIKYEGPAVLLRVIVTKSVSSGLSSLQVNSLERSSSKTSLKTKDEFIRLNVSLVFLKSTGNNGHNRDSVVSVILCITSVKLQAKK